MRRHLVLVLAVTAAACSPSDTTSSTSSTSTTSVVVTSTSLAPDPTTTTTNAPTTSTTARLDFGVSSPSFADGDPIPELHTCDGLDTSPALEVVGLPIATAGVAIVMNDPDASLGPWDHWVVFDILPISNALDIEAGETSLGIRGINSWRVEGYKGPCPPEGETHTYVISVYALDALLELPAGIDSATLEAAMDGHIIGSVELTGTYGR